MKNRSLAAVAALALLIVPALALAAGPPTVTTVPPDPTLTTDTYALLSGVINPNGTATSYWFEWGPTTAYGNTTPVTSAGNGTADVPVDISIEGLSPQTEYHYRLVGQPTAGGDPIYGQDVLFKTSKPLQLYIKGGRTAVQDKRALVTLSCFGPPDDSCDGRLTIKSVVKGKSAYAGSASYSVPVGKTKTIKVFLIGAAQKLIEASPTKHLQAVATTTPRRTKTQVHNKLLLRG